MISRSTIPERLRKEPLLEALWEVRFVGTTPSAGELLPGILFDALQERYPNVVRLPTADIPAVASEHDPNLRYLPRIRLEGGNQAIQVGQHVVSLSCRRPYPGWEAFSRDIRRLVEVLRSTGLIEHPQRFSLKYVDLLEATDTPTLDALDVSLTIGRYTLNTHPVQLWTEIRQGDVAHLVRIVSPASVTIPGEDGELRGVLLDIDSIRSVDGEDPWHDVERNLDAVHASAKQIFFEMLTDATLERLEPEYPGADP